MYLYHNNLQLLFRLEKQLQNTTRIDTGREIFLIRRLSTIVFLYLLLITIAPTSQAAVTDPACAGALWTAKFSDPYFMGTSMTSTPIVTSDTVYVVNRDTLYALDTRNGTTRWELLLTARMNSVCDPVMIGDDLFIPLSDGILQCVNLRTHTTCWISETHLPDGEKSAQTLGRLSYSDGFLYAGTWVAKPGANTDTDIRSDGIFFCVDCRNGHTVWTYRDTGNPTGFYWTQSVSIHERIFFTAEDGTLISHGKSEDIVYEKYSLTEGKQLRCGLCLDEKTDSIFTVSKDGTLIRIRLSADGTILAVDKAALIPDAAINCTSTPTLYKGRLYVGCIADGYGQLCVVDADTLRLIYTAKGPKSGEIKSRPLVIPEDTDTNIETGRGSDTASPTDAVSVYVTANDKKGALYLLCDSKETTSGKLETIFTPYTAKQYCLANAVRGPDDVVYYSNDSGTLFAIGETPISADLPAKEKKKRKKVINAIIKKMQLLQICNIYFFHVSHI